MTDSAHLDKVAEAICAAHTGDNDAWDITYDGGRDTYRVMAQAAIDALQLTEEDLWVPVTESGDRWKPRSEGQAKRDKVKYPVGGRFSDGVLWDGITHLEHETRLVSGWVRVDGGDQ